MKRSVKLLFVLYLITHLSVFSQSISSSAGLNSIQKEEIINSVVFLASDSLKGRFSGTMGNDIAAEFIAKKFKQYGLIPIGNDIKTSKRSGIKRSSTLEHTIYDYFQKFAILKSRLSARNQLKLIFESPISSKTISFDYGTDFIVQSRNVFNDIKICAPIVFAGYGIEKGEKDYSDYVTDKNEKIDVKNRIVLIVDGFPQEQNPESDFSKSRNPFYRNPLRKMEVARDLGALAIMVISSPLKNELSFSLKFKSRKLAFEIESFNLTVQTTQDIPIIFISENLAHQIFNESKKSLKEILHTIENKLRGQAFEFQNLKVEIELNFEREIIQTQNVVGMIEGTDENLKNDFIVIGAHYDHVGLGYYGAMNKADTGKIHNGADDNASGTSVLIELAEAFSLDKPKRSLILIAFSGEEEGLLGSRYYVYHQPLKPLEKTIAMFNFDMVGRNEPELLWIGGVFYSDDLRKLIEKANGSINFELLFNVGLLNFASDQAPFLRKNIPSAFFFSGLHDDYHTPEDDYDKIDYEKITRVAKLGFLSVKLLADSNVIPLFKELTIDERKELVEESIIKLKKYRSTSNIKEHGDEER